MVIELDRKDRAKLKELQSRLESISVDWTLSQLAVICLQTGLYQKLQETDKI